jgi:hypothetical protein
LQATQVYRKQTTALAAATETFVQALQEFSDCVPEGFKKLTTENITNRKLVKDLDFLIDSSQILANCHQRYANDLQNYVEEPFTNSIPIITQKSVERRKSNTIQINDLQAQLHIEESKVKKTKRNSRIIGHSLKTRLGLAEKIKKLAVDNENTIDSLTHEHGPVLLGYLSNALEAEIDTYETVLEGFRKIFLHDINSETKITKEIGKVINRDILTFRMML